VYKGKTVLPRLLLLAPFSLHARHCTLGTLDVIWKIIAQEGLLGLYVGLQPQLLKSALSSSLVPRQHSTRAPSSYTTMDLCSCSWRRRRCSSSCARSVPRSPAL